MPLLTYFVTGTDTESGKTFCTAALLRAAANQGRISIGFKPVASEAGEDGLNTDVLALQVASSVRLDYKQHNIYTFSEATAPHLAAADMGMMIQPQKLSDGLIALKKQGDFILTEGAGGWLTPLNHQTDFSDWVAFERLPVIMVVGMKLGCLNHALLTARAVAQAGLPLAGWIANCLSAYSHRFEDYLAELKQRIPAPFLGAMPYLPHADADKASAYLSIEPLLNFDKHRKK
ncbi:dethiobiotin synthase [Neisseria montereyensis]|uniref:ATP-dependent dethiobiotin synthetase BioD n=1 Tax=Neisseria montereyensis TaxID=2973938 RepID=A0ABT2FEZ2_9NEIS|nr:dethiobiotin synthase [Neisseria montereyensis]MCS4534090.1 dethiobiotin synthase [Neisseria montereyensis]